MHTQTEYKHIVLDEEGIPRIEGTRLKVRLLVIQAIVNGWSAEELKWQFPQLTMAQVYAALAYYYEHEDEMNQQTQREAQQDDSHWPILKLSRSELERRLRHP